MTKRQFTILLLSNDPGGTCAWDVFHSFYKKSQQPVKKVMGLFKEMRTMSRGGLLRQMPGPGKPSHVRFFITPDGKRAALARGVNTGPKPPPKPFMRLASE